MKNFQTLPLQIASELFTTSPECFYPNGNVNHNWYCFVFLKFCEFKFYRFCYVFNIFVVLPNMGPIGVKLSKCYTYKSLRNYFQPLPNYYSVDLKTLF